MSLSILHEQVPELMRVLQGKIPSSGGVWILESAYVFSRMLHGSGAPSSDAFYRAFVPELGSVLYPRQIELVKRCLKSERGETDRVGATIFPGLVKVSRAPPEPGKEGTVQVSKPEVNHCDVVCLTRISQTVVRRAQVICECAMGGSSIPGMSFDEQQPGMPQGMPMLPSAPPSVGGGMQFQQPGYF
jgi:hypothetical protein